jgi:hypothetical protein
MAGDQQIRCINKQYQTLKEMVDITSPAYGSLYFADAPARICFQQDIELGILHWTPLRSYVLGLQCGRI